MDETVMIVTAAHPLVREMLQNIGAERLTLERLQRENAEAGFTEDCVGLSVATRFGFRLADLPAVIEALQMPEGVRSRLRGR